MKFKSSDAHNQRLQRISNSHLVVGVDIAKETHVARAVDFRGLEIGRPCVFENHRDGYDKLMNWIHLLQRQHGFTQLIVGLESTGHYWFNLADYLHRLQIPVVLVNPLTTKRNKENRDNRPSKNDYKDAITIAESVSRGFYSNFIVREAIYLRLRAVVNEREYWSNLQTTIQNRLLRALDIVFPEFTSLFKEWNCPRGMATLRAFPLPSEITLLDVESILEGWKKAGMKRGGGLKGRQKAAELLAAARRSVGYTDAALEYRQELQRLLDAYEHVQSQIAATEARIEELMKNVPKATVKPLQSIGVSPLFIACLLANTGDLRRFKHGQQVLALAGLGLAECTSGKRRGQVVLSKRGRRQLRKYLYLVVMGLVVNHSAFKRWHTHNVHTLRMKKQKSLFKLIGKFARILVALARSGESFDPEKASALPCPKAA